MTKQENKTQEELLNCAFRQVALYLALGRLVGRVQLKNSLKVISCSVKLLHTKKCFSPSEQSFLIGIINLQSLEPCLENN